MGVNFSLLELVALIAILWPLLGLAAIPGWLFGGTDRVKSLRLVFSILFGFWVIFFALRFVSWLSETPLPTPLPLWLESILFFAAGLSLATALLLVFSLPTQPPKPAFLLVKTSADLLELSNPSFSRLVKYIYQNTGYQLEIPANPSQAQLVNFIATSAGQPTRLVHARRYAGRVGEPVLRELYRMLDVYPNAYIDVITSGTFSPQAEEFAQGKPFHLIDGDGIIGLLQYAQKTGK